MVKSVQHVFFLSFEQLICLVTKTLGNPKFQFAKKFQGGDEFSSTYFYALSGNCWVGKENINTWQQSL